MEPHVQDSEIIFFSYTHFFRERDALHVAFLFHFFCSTYQFFYMKTLHSEHIFAKKYVLLQTILKQKKHAYRK